MKYVIYSHTDYLDILNVHSDYLKFEENVLLINSNDLELGKLYSKFGEVFFYDEKLPYPKRVLSCLNQLNTNYLLFIHDIDIPLEIDFPVFDKIKNFCIMNNLDRVDLQQDIRIDKQKYINSEIFNLEDFELVDFKDANNYYACLVRNDDPNNYIYNVNPSIWKKNTFMEILNEFENETYRTIENKFVQFFCQRYKIYKLSSSVKKNSGYYSVTPIFQFLHMTHEGGLMPYDAKVNGADEDLNEHYTKILKNYNFTKPFRRSMH